MARNKSRLSRTDAVTFAALTVAGNMTSRQASAAIQRAENTALSSLQRLVLHGLATVEPGKRNGFASGAAPWVWTIIPGAVFPGPAPRKTYTLQIVGQDDDEAPPVRIRRKGDVPESVASKIGLAGLVAQVTR